MGWQVNFYGTQKDMNELCDYIKSKGGIIINEDGEELTEDDLQRTYRTHRQYSHRQARGLRRSRG